MAGVVVILAGTCAVVVLLLLGVGDGAESSEAQPVAAAPDEGGSGESGSEGREADEGGSDEAADPGSASEGWLTCEDLLPDVVAISEETEEWGATVVQVYDITMVADWRDEIEAGTRTAPEGEKDVSVIECTRAALWSDGDMTRIEFDATMDRHDDLYVYLTVTG